MAYPDDEDFETMYERIMNDPSEVCAPHPMDDPHHPGWDESARSVVRTYLEIDASNREKFGTPEYRPEDDFWGMVDRGEMSMIPDYILDEFRNNK